MSKIQTSVVAGMFYPSDPYELQATITQFFSQVNSTDVIPKALIAPHAGYIYSGFIAACAYACLQNKNPIKRVIILAPSHRYPFQGVATSEAYYFETPLGKISIDHQAIQPIINRSEVNFVNEAFANEHSLEVQLPFLQMTLNTFTLVPLLIGYTDIKQIAKILETLWGDSETLIIISSDLSHYHPYDIACKIDQLTTNKILNFTPVNAEEACGALGINALLAVAKMKHLTPHLIRLQNSGDTKGSKNEVVGYGAFHFTETQS